MKNANKCIARAFCLHCSNGYQLRWGFLFNTPEQNRKVLYCCQKYDLNISQDVHVGEGSEFNGQYTIIAMVTRNLIDCHTWTSKHSSYNCILGT